MISTVVVLLVAGSWACATQFSKSALDVDPTRFYAPYSMVWFSTLFMCVCYPVYLGYVAVLAGRNQKPETSEGPLPTTLTTKPSKICALRSAHREACQVFGQESGLKLALNACQRVLPFLVMWVAANYSYSYALGHISASAASAIMSANTAVVCFLGYAILGARPSALKVRNIEEVAHVHKETH